MGLTKVSPRILRALIIAGLLGANFFVVALSAYSLYQSRQQHELRARDLTRNMAEAIDQSMANSIDKIDLALLAITDELESHSAQSGKAGLDPRLVEAILARYQQRLPEVEAIRVANADGLVIFGKGLNPQEGASWTDRDYFIYLREHPDAGLQISKPRVGRVAKTPIVGFSRRFTTPDGRFAGVVSAPVAVDYFAGLLSRFKIGPGGTAILRDADLGLIARYPAIADDPAGVVGNSIVSHELRELEQTGVSSASYYSPMTADRQERILSFRRMSRSPMMVIVGLSSASYLGEWHAEVYKTAAGDFCFAILSLLSGWMVLRLLNEMARESFRNRLFLHHASDGIHILDERGRLVQASEQFCRMLGYERSAMIGMNVAQWDVRWPADVLLEKILPGKLAEHTASTFETRHRRQDGEIIDVELNAVGFEMDGKAYLFASSRDIGEKKRQQQALIDSEAHLRESRERYRLLLGNSPVGILHYDEALVITYANERFEQIMRLPPGAALGLDCKQLKDQSVVPPMRKVIDGAAGHYEGPYVTSYGNVGLWISLNCAPVRDAQGKTLGGIAIVEDITERKRVESELRLAASVFSHAHEGIIICDAKQTILEANPTFSEITGYSRAEVIGRTPRILNSGRHDADFYAAMWQAIADHGHWEGEVWNRRKDGSTYAERLTVSSVPDERGVVTHYIGTFSDISLLKEQQAELEHLAHYDALTRLPNRALLADRMALALAQAKRAGTLMAVCYLDLDGFKAINDEYGHDTGDALLVEMAHRLRDSLRAGDTVARLGGDEFVLLLGGMDSMDECDHTANRVLKALAAPVRIGEHECGVSGSLGISLFPHDDSGPDTLLRHADQAMYLAKQAGKNCYQLYDAAQDQRARNRQEIFGQLRQALERDEFRLHYQPIVDMRHGKVLAFEGLIRWQHPERGLLFPADFLPAAEDSELDQAIGRWVLAAGLRQLALWREQGLPQRLCLNVSAGHLLAPTFVGELRGLLAGHPGIEPHALEIEVMESAAITDLDTTIAVFRNCHEAGIDIALDDFGTGYSALSCFRRLPVDTLKIDQMFVHSVLGNEEDLAIVESVIKLTNAFNRKLVAEGVESVEIGMLLLHLGCNVGQGHGIAHPMPADQIPAWTAGFVPDRNWSVPANRFRREDIPLLLAELEHRSWVKALQAWLATDAQVSPPPQMDEQLCRFGQWYAGAGRQRYGRLAAFKALNDVHQAVHRLGRELTSLHLSGHCAEARARIGEVEAWRDRLIEQLAALQSEAVVDRM